VQISVRNIQNKILLLRREKVILDADLAELYGVATRVLIQAVKRNFDRFPEDFMFQLTEKEVEILRSQYVTSSWGGRRYSPYAFTEQGVAMVSSVLRSQRAIEVNIMVMRVFVQLREFVVSNEQLSRKLSELEKKYDNHFKIVFDAIRQLITSPEKPKRPFGFQPPRKTESDK